MKKLFLLSLILILVWAWSGMASERTPDQLTKGADAGVIVEPAANAQFQLDESEIVGHHVQTQNGLAPQVPTGIFEGNFEKVKDQGSLILTPQNCDVGSAYGQDPWTPADSWAFNTSDNVLGPYLVFDNFVPGVTGITDLTWWGLSLFNNGTWNACTDLAEEFEIIFYPDLAGAPDLGAPAYTYSAVVPTQTLTGEVFAGVFEEIRYDLTLPTSADMPNGGWISIQATGTGGDIGNCSFLWATGPCGDLDALQDQGAGPVALGQNQAFCMTGTYVPVYGSCCDDALGSCNDNVEYLDCFCTGERFTANTLCADLDPACVAPPFGPCESFDADLGTMNLYQVSGQGWAYTGTDGQPAGAAFHNDWTGTNDSYMITRGAYTVPTGASLVFDQKTNYWPTYYELNEVLISTDYTDGADPSTATWTQLYEGSGGGYEDVWGTVQIALTAYEGQGVHVAFHYYGTFATEWWIDNVCIMWVPEPQVCPEGTVYEHPFGTYSSSSTSDSYFGYEVYDNVEGFYGDVTGLHWWGIKLLYSGGFIACDPPDDPDLFNIGFFPDDGTGYPDVANPTAIFTNQAPTLYDTQIPYAGLTTIIGYDLTLPNPVTITNGWVMIQGADQGEACVFLWTNDESGTGDMRGLQWNGSAWTVNAYDYTLCVVGNAVALPGACCDETSGICTDNVDIVDCMAPGMRFAANTLCADIDPPCVPPTYTGCESFDYGLNTFATYTTLGPGFIFSSTMGVPPGAAFHNDDSGDNDAWLISRGAFNVPAGSMLSFDQQTNWCAGYYELHEVMISTDYTDGADPATATWTQLYEGSACEDEDVWGTHAIDISSYGGMDVHVGFHYTGNFATEWWIDNVCIGVPPVGACCDAGLTCLGDMTYFDCIAQGGSDFYEGESCVGGFICPAPITAGLATTGNIPDCGVSNYGILGDNDAQANTYDWSTLGAVDYEASFVMGNSPTAMFSAYGDAECYPYHPTGLLDMTDTYNPTAQFDDNGVLGGLTIDYCGHGYNVDNPPVEASDVFVHVYSLTNNSGSDITGFYAGLYFDWDIGATDYITYDRADNLVIQGNDTGDYFYGLCLFNASDLGGVGSLAAIAQQDYIYDQAGWLMADLYTVMSDGNDGMWDAQAADMSSLVSTVATTIPAGQTVTYKFAVIGGATEADVIADAQYILANLTVDDCAGGGGPSPCGDYVVGDFNNDTFFNVTDITNGFSQLKSGTSPNPPVLCTCIEGHLPPDWAVAMDVNGNCAFNVADITDGFKRLKLGRPQEDPCPECAPDSWVGGVCCYSDNLPPCDVSSEARCNSAGGTWYAGEDCGTFTCPGPPSPRDGNTPLVVPNLESKMKVQQSGGME